MLTPTRIVTQTPNSAQTDRCCAWLTVIVQVITVQKYFRRMLAKCHADRLRLRARCQLELEQQQLVVKAAGSERRMQRHFQRRLNPRTKDDFSLVYNAMEGSACYCLSHDCRATRLCMISFNNYYASTPIGRRH